MNKGNEILRNFDLLQKARKDLHETLTGYWGVPAYCVAHTDEVIRGLIKDICGMTVKDNTVIKEVKKPDGCSYTVYASTADGKGPYYYVMTPPGGSRAVDAWSSLDDDSEGFEDVETAIKEAETVYRDNYEDTTDDIPY